VIDLRKAVWISGANLLRQVRDRTDLFFVFVLPTLIIVALGLQYGGGNHVRLGVVVPSSDAAATAFVDALGADSSLFEVRAVATLDELHSLVERGRVEAGVVIPDGFAASLQTGRPTTVTYLATTGSLTTGIRASVESEVARLNAIATAASVAADIIGVPVATTQPIAATLYPAQPGVTITTQTVGESGPFAGFSQFAFGATTQLILFMFLTSLTASARLVYTRRLGVSARMLSTPTSATTIVVGEALGRFWIAMLQAVFIVGLSTLVFGVRWGDPLAAGILIGLFGIAAAGLALLVGAIARDPDQASSMGVFAGLALGALGGCMIPYQYMPEAMQTFARLLPHSWAVLGLQSLIRDGGGLASVLPNVAVLAVWAVGSMVLAAWRFRKAITG
jgi:ABC-2 type transport system permease protein